MLFFEGNVKSARSWLIKIYASYVTFPEKKTVLKTDREISDSQEMKTWGKDNYVGYHPSFSLFSEPGTR